MAITFQKVPVDVLVFRLGKCWVLVEQVGNEGQVQFGIATDHISWCDELSAAEPICLLKHVLCSSQVILLLPGVQWTRVSWNRRGCKSRREAPDCWGNVTAAPAFIRRQLLLEYGDEACMLIPAAVGVVILICLGTSPSVSPSMVLPQFLRFPTCTPFELGGSEVAVSRLPNGA